VIYDEIKKRHGNFVMDQMISCSGVELKVEFHILLRNMKCPYFHKDLIFGALHMNHYKSYILKDQLGEPERGSE
jgi:hypothetical protein